MSILELTSTGDRKKDEDLANTLEEMMDRIDIDGTSGSLISAQNSAKTFRVNSTQATDSLDLKSSGKVWNTIHFWQTLSWDKSKELCPQVTGKCFRKRTP